MANEVRFDIVAGDKASKTLDDVAGKAEKIEKLDPTVTVDADTKSAANDVEAFTNKLDGLTDTDKVVVLALRAGNVKSELTDLALDLATIDAADPTIELKLDRYAELSGQLDDLEQKIKDVADVPPIDPDPGDVGKKKLAAVGDEASKTQGAVHSMAGNAIGDFAATTTGIGPIGEALGQLTEMAAGGEAGLKQLAVAGLGVGAIAGGIALLNVVMGHFREEARKAAEIKAFDEKNVRDYTDAVLAAKAAIEGTSDATKKIHTDDMTFAMGTLKTQAQELIDVWRKAGEVKLLDAQTGEIHDFLPLLAEAGISAQTFAEAIAGSQSAMLAVDAAAGRANLTLDEQQAITKTLFDEQQKYRQGLDAAADRTTFFAGVTASAVIDLGHLVAKTADYVARSDEAKAKTQGLTDGLKGFKKSAQDAADQYEHLTDALAHDQAYIDLADQLDAVTEAGDNAYEAQKDANTAIKKNASDATEKQREAERSMRDYQSAVISAKNDIIELGRTAHATPVQVQAALKKIDDGDLAGAKADAEAWSRRNPVQITGKITLSNLGAALSQAANAGIHVTGVTGAPSSTTINQFLARPVAAREIAATQARHRRINGR